MPIVFDFHDSLIVQKFIQEGREEGLAAARRLVTLQLEQRFGKVPAKFARRIGAADLAGVEQFGLRILGARNIEEVFSSPRS